jgi:SAM-dependent methyltransferase
MADPNSQHMLQMITGYWVSQIVSVLAQLDIPDLLSAKPQRADQIASEIGCDPQATLRLMRAAANLGVLAAAPDGTFALTPLGETLRSDVPGSLHDFAIALNAPGHWLPWGRLADAVKEGSRQTAATLGRDLFEHYMQNPAEGLAFMGAMANLSALVAAEVARLIDTSAASLAVDVGGATGTVVAALLRKNPALKGAILERQRVAEGARAALAEEGLSARCEVIEGDFFEAVPAADLYIVKHIIHDWNDEQSVHILTNCAKALRKNGRVVLVEMVLPEDGRPSFAPLMDINMLVLTPGRERTAKQYGELLHAAGLQLDRVVDTQSPMQIIEASARS